MTYDDLEARVADHLREVAATVPDLPPRSFASERSRGAAASRRWRWRLGMGIGVAALFAGGSAGLPAAFAAFHTSQTPTTPPTTFTVPTVPRQTSPPPQLKTSGPAITPTTVLSDEVRRQGPDAVTRSAIKTAPYETVMTVLRNAGIMTSRNADPTWTPVPKHSPIDVVVLAGSVRSPSSGATAKWLIELVVPSTGEVFEWDGSTTGGTWPTVVTSLPK